ncbi:MAG: hypothetical protein EZS28_023445 [Streblomastix strix]|uniref:Uncharacterized protein n=1 Tax=Streblomastix strix TaxID=222440 RepID=A0A5J4VEJ9_9EUKA|nr:MAG: hypothetical protein EZS28_023445 [Streblomastix strix]
MCYTSQLIRIISSGVCVVFEKLCREICSLNLVAKAIGESINCGNPEKKRRRPKVRKLDEKAKEVPSSQKNDGLINGQLETWRRHRWRLGQFDEY